MRLCNMAPFIFFFSKNSMHVRLWGCMWCYDKWNGRVPTIKRDIELNINIRLLHIPSWWVRFSANVFVSSNWTQRIKSLVNFITYLESPYLLDYNYIVVPLPTRFLWVHILMVKVCKNSSQKATQTTYWLFRNDPTCEYCI
jgi:hypothetical protein